MFPKDDSVKSKRPPPEPGCFACGSLLHWVRDCKHHGAWQLKSAYIVNGEDQESEEHRRAYFVMLTETDDEPTNSSHFP